MISNQDFHKELEYLEKTREACNDPIAKAQIKIGILTLKFLHNIRTNQTLIMDKVGAEKIKTKKVEENKEEKRK